MIAASRGLGPVMNKLLSELPFKASPRGKPAPIATRTTAGSARKRPSQPLPVPRLIPPSRGNTTRCQLNRYRDR